MWRNIKNKIIGHADVFFTPFNKIALKINGGGYGTNLKIKGFLRIHNPKGKIIIGDNVRINSAEWANPIGFTGRTNLKVIGAGLIKIGNNVGISCASFVANTSITIGDRVLIGAGVKIYDTDFHSLNKNERFDAAQKDVSVHSNSVQIGDDCFIGAGAMILKGVQIGDNVVVGANSVVTRNLESNSIYAGNPAILIRKL